MESLRELYRIGRGPSSSHTMGPSHAATLFREKFPQADRFEAVLYGSLAKTGKGHLTDVAIQDAFAPAATHIVFDTQDAGGHPAPSQHHGAFRLFRGEPVGQVAGVQRGRRQDRD